MHARMRNRTAQWERDTPDIVAPELPLDKPNLRFAPENIPQDELTLLMQPQPLAEVQPFLPTLESSNRASLLIVARTGSECD